MNLTIGKKYYVELRDCCVHAVFTDVLVAYDEELDEYEFEHIYLERAYQHAIKLEEAKE